MTPLVLQMYSNFFPAMLAEAGREVDRAVVRRFRQIRWEHTYPAASNEESAALQATMQVGYMRLVVSRDLFELKLTQALSDVMCRRCCRHYFS